MKRTKTFAAVGFLVILGACLLAVLAGVSGSWIAAAVFAAVAAVFVYVSVLYGSTLTLDEAGLRRSFFGLRLHTVPWSAVAEVGVVGLKVFNNNDPKRTGTLYLYFSPRALDKDSRFKLALEWPPRDMLYLCYTKDRAAAVRALWSGPIETFNAGDLFF